MTDPDPDPLLVAGVAHLQRTGAANVTIGHTAEEDHKPVVWYACARYEINAQGVPVKPGSGGNEYYEAAAAMDPAGAVLRLCTEMTDGAQCAHCGRPTGFDPAKAAGTMPLDNLVCWYQYDPGTRKFIKGCA